MRDKNKIMWVPFSFCTSSCSNLWIKLIHTPSSSRQVFICIHTFDTHTHSHTTHLAKSPRSTSSISLTFDCLIRTLTHTLRNTHTHIYASSLHLSSCMSGVSKTSTRGSITSSGAGPTLVAGCRYLCVCLRICKCMDVSMSNFFFFRSLHYSTYR